LANILAISPMGGGGAINTLRRFADSRGRGAFGSWSRFYHRRRLDQQGYLAHKKTSPPLGLP
jgi:hypothetical protein